VTAYATYQETEILSSSPEQLILLLYRRLLSHLRQGAECLEADDIQRKADHFEKASAIIYELTASLDHEIGGELSGQLAALYAFFLREIAAASLARDRKRLDRVIELVSRLYESWVGAAREIAEAANAVG